MGVFLMTRPRFATTLDFVLFLPICIACNFFRRWSIISLNCRHVFLSLGT